MSGRYLYCQNCGTYLGCSGGDECSLCGWRAGRSRSEMEEAEREEEDE